MVASHQESNDICVSVGQLTSLVTTEASPVGCTFCRVTLTFVIGLAGLAAGYFLGAGIAAAPGNEVRGSTIAHPSEANCFCPGTFLDAPRPRKAGPTEGHSKRTRL